MLQGDAGFFLRGRIGNGRSLIEARNNRILIGFAAGHESKHEKDDYPPPALAYLKYYNRARQLMSFPITRVSLNTIKEIRITVQVENLMSPALATDQAFSGYAGTYFKQYSGAY